MKKQKIAFYGSTGLLSIMMLLSAGMYIFNHQEVAGIFVSLGFPTYIIYPLAAAKILGLAAIWTNYSKTLKEWAYAGFFYDFLLALSGHLNAGDGDWGGAVVALLLLAVSYFSDRKVRG